MEATHSSDQKSSINPQEIRGNWRSGWALDIHTISSRHLGDGKFDTTRTELGELVYRLKNHDAKKTNDRTNIQPIAEVASKFVKKKFKVNDHYVYDYVKAIIPTPPSDQDRYFQPVIEIAVKMGKILGLPVPVDYLIKIKETKQHKSIESEDSRKEQLQAAFAVHTKNRTYSCVLLFDDIYRSGETLTEITHVLQKQGNISRVLVLTLTYTRTKR